MWQLDGAGWRARVGALTPHLDPVPETELRAMAPQGVSIHAARVPLGTLDRDGNISLQRGAGAALAFAEPPHVDHAAMLLASIPASVIVYAYTSSSYILGVDGDKALKARLEARAPGIPVVIPMPACCLALRAVGARRIALIHPPWFSADVTEAAPNISRASGLRSSITLRHRCAATLVKSTRVRSTTGRAGMCQIRPRRWSSAAMVCAPSARSRHWRRTWAVRSCLPTKSHSGMRSTLRVCTRLSIITGASSPPTLHPKHERTVMES
jgi:hypothetical protein